MLALAAGQTVGKLVLFEAARRGSGRLERRFANRREGRAARWADRIRDSLRSRRTGLPMVLASAALGVPPLAAVSLAAGAAGQRAGSSGCSAWSAAPRASPLLVLPAVWAFS